MVDIHTIKWRKLTHNIIPNKWKSIGSALCYIQSKPTCAFSLKHSLAAFFFYPPRLCYRVALCVCYINVCAFWFVFFEQQWKEAGNFRKEKEVHNPSCMCARQHKVNLAKKRRKISNNNSNSKTTNDTERNSADSIHLTIAIRKFTKQMAIIIYNNNLCALERAF